MAATQSSHESYGTAADRPPKVRWGVVAGFVGLGGAMLAGGAWADDYARDLLVSLGTALLLFAFIYLAERRLIEAVEEVRGPHTLAEAQRQLADLVRSARQHGGGGHAPTKLAAAREEAVERVAKKLVDAGLRQQPPGGRTDAITFADEAGLGIRWQIAWDPPGLRHVITVGDAAFRSAVALSRDEPRQLSVGDLTSEAESQLREFEEEVFPWLRTIVWMLRST